MHSRVEAFHRMLDRARAARGLALMGVCNITPDSFSDGGRYHAPDAARARIDELLAEGADIVDIGGESTRPGAPEVPAAEQKERVLDAIGYAAARDACVSIDTTNPEVAAAAFEAGASILNDASCLRDEGLARAAAAARGAVILMHTRGTPADMHGFSRYPDGGYDDVVRDVCAEWAAAAERLRSAGVPDGAIVMDPGLGFAKNARQSIELLRRLPEVVAAVRVPVTVGASRKSFLASVDPFTIFGPHAKPSTSAGAWRGNRPCSRASSTSSPSARSGAC
ncbi:MAG: dihydropteroate synthase [Polyangiaceae bacterium]